MSTQRVFGELPIPSVQLAVALAAVALAYIFHTLTRYPSGLPPGPKPSLFNGNRGLIPRKRPWLKLAEIGKQYPAGLFTIWTGPRPTIVVTSAKVAADLLDKRSNIYSSRPRFVVAGELMSGGNSILFAPYGDKWRRLRKLYHAALMGKSGDTYRPIQEMEAKRLVHELVTNPEKWEKHIERFSASSTVAIAYGRRVDSADVGFIRSITERMEALSTINLPGKQILDSYPFLQDLPEWMTPYKRRWRAYREESDRFWMGLVGQVEERIKLATAAPSFAKDLLDRGREAVGLSDGEFGLLVGGIVGAGIETTSGSLVAFMLAMVSFPEAQTKAQAELDRVVGPERSPTWEDEENLPYCRALIQEVLRWRPVAVLGGTPHASTEDDVYEGYLIPAGSTILANTWAIHHDPDYFPEPDVFKPERYINSPEKPYPQRGGSSAFGWGRRICPGMHVAERAIYIAVVTTLHHFTISTPDGHPAPDIFAFSDGFNSRADPFPIKVTPRSEGILDLISREQAQAWEGLLGVSFSSLFSKLSGLFSRQSEVRILMLGLDSAGKTTILYRLQIGEIVQTIPTIGFNVETVQYKNIKFQVWDLGGQTSIRPYWRCYYADTKAVVYVVDSSDRERLGVNKAELLAMLSEDELADARLLVFANKQDQPDAMTPAEVSEGLGLDTLKNRQWSIHKSCAIKGEGLEEGLDWLVTALQSK